MTFDAATCTLTKQTVYHVQVVQRDIELAMLGVKLLLVLYLVRNVEIRWCTTKRDIGAVIIGLNGVEQNMLLGRAMADVRKTCQICGHLQL